MSSSLLPLHMLPTINSSFPDGFVVIRPTLLGHVDAVRHVSPSATAISAVRSQRGSARSPAARSPRARSSSAGGSAGPPAPRRQRPLPCATRPAPPRGGGAEGPLGMPRRRRSPPRVPAAHGSGGRPAGGGGPRATAARRRRRTSQTALRRAAQHHSI